MVNRDMSRRTLLRGGGAALTGLATLQVAGPAHAFPGGSDETVLPWIDQPAPSPFPPQFVQLKWEQLDSWFIPNDEFFVVYHFDPAEPHRGELSTHHQRSCVPAPVAGARRPQAASPP